MNEQECKAVMIYMAFAANLHGDLLDARI